MVLCFASKTVSCRLSMKYGPSFWECEQIVSLFIFSPELIVTAGGWNKQDSCQLPV